MDLRHDYCMGCGAILAAGARVDREWCSPACYNTHYHQLEKAARLEAKRDRPPCAHCGGPVAPEKPACAVYCSLLCARRTNYLRRMEHRHCALCGGEYLACHARQRYCGTACADRAKRRHQPRPCAQCGATFTPRQPAAKYCTRRCAGLARVQPPPPCAWCAAPLTRHRGKRFLTWCSRGCASRHRAHNPEEARALVRAATITPVIGRITPPG